AGERVEPHVPGGHEAEGVPKGAACPHVQAAFERHRSVEVVDGHCHGQVERNQSEQPDHRLCTAQARGDAHPGAADDGEYLRKNQIAEAELSMEMMVGVAAGGFVVRNVRHPYTLEHFPCGCNPTPQL